MFKDMQILGYRMEDWELSETNFFAISKFSHKPQQERK